MIGKILRAVVPARYRPSGHIQDVVRRRTKGRVAAGPFAGMQLLGERVHLAKLLGTYERELNSSIERTCSQKYSLVVDAGAAEGYYAVGMALRNPDAKVVAFEMNDETRSVLQETVRLNQVGDRVDVRGKCEPANLRAALTDASRALLICDVEGYEQELLNLTSVPELLSTSILVELHEFVVRGIGKEIRRRFSATHGISEIRQEDRTEDEFPFTDFYVRHLPKSYLRWAVGESRPERMSWFWMEPKQHGAG